MVRQQNTKIDEPKDFNDLTKTLESQQMRQLDRERKLDEIRRQLEETKQALIAARSGSAGGETTEEIKNAEAAIALAKELESELQTEGIKDTMQNKSVLYGIFINPLRPSPKSWKIKLIDSTYKLELQGHCHPMYRR